jgi:hypothetical protein
VCLGALNAMHITWVVMLTIAEVPWPFLLVWRIMSRSQATWSRRVTCFGAGSAWRARAGREVGTGLLAVQAWLLRCISSAVLNLEVYMGLGGVHGSEKCPKSSLLFQVSNK